MLLSTRLLARMKLIDIGANLTDKMYGGEYNGSSRHPPDLQAVIERARQAGVVKMMVTGGSLEESRSAIKLVKEQEGLLVATVGCHPTRCKEFEEAEGGPDTYFNNLLGLIRDNPGQVVAVGECGLDYDRTNFCDIETQQKYFLRQLELSQATSLPLFLHCRAAAVDLVKLLGDHKEMVRAGGVVHSFDGSAEDRDKILDLGLYIGINGCSLKTEENLAVMAGIPVDRLMIETDCPWCEVRPSHAGHKHVQSKVGQQVDKKKWVEGAVVKGRNEPHNLRQILEIVAAVRGEEDLEGLAEKIYQNTENVFFRTES